MDAQREMTLREFVNTLPKCHRARKELAAIEMAMASVRPILVSNYDQLRATLDIFRRGETPRPIPAYDGEWDRCDHVITALDDALKLFQD